MRLTTRTNLAARVLMFCAANPGTQVRSAQIAAACNASANHVARVVQQLQSEGFLSTRRGRTGGLQLARPPSAISIGTVFRLFETEIPFAECFDPVANTCPLTGTCRLKRYLTRALDAFYQELDRVTLDDLTQGNCGLDRLLALSPALPGACDASDLASDMGPAAAVRRNGP